MSNEILIIKFPVRFVFYDQEDRCGNGTHCRTCSKEYSFDVRLCFAHERYARDEYNQLSFPKLDFETALLYRVKEEEEIRWDLEDETCELVMNDGFLDGCEYKCEDSYTLAYASGQDYYAVRNGGVPVITRHSFESGEEELEAKEITVTTATVQDL